MKRNTNKTTPKTKYEERRKMKHFNMVEVFLSCLHRLAACFLLPQS